MEALKLRSLSCVAVLTLLLHLLGASSVVARTPLPPPFIHSNSIRGELVSEWNALVAREANLDTMNRDGRRILAKAYGPGRFYREFPHGFDVDLTRSDTKRVANNLLKGNSRNWHGYSRELKVLSYIQSARSPFNLIETGSRAKFRGKTTEFDTLLEHKQTKLRAVIEIKDRQIRSAKDLASTKDQITRIAKRARRERVASVAWVNRQTLSPKALAALTKHAAPLGVSIYHNVTTGVRQAGIGGSRSLEGVMRRESMKLNRMARAQAPGQVTAPRPTRVAPAGSNRPLATRIGGPLLGVTSIGWGVYQYYSGGMNTRAAISGVATASGAFAGGAAGAKGGAIAGAMIGSFFPGIGTAVGAAAGGVIGGVGGAVGGGMIVGAVANSYTQNLIANLDAEGQLDLIKALRKKYAPAP